MSGGQFTPNPCSPWTDGGHSTFRDSTPGEYPISVTYGPSSYGGGTIVVIRSEIQADGLAPDHPDNTVFYHPSGASRLQVGIGAAVPGWGDYVRVTLSTHHTASVWTDAEGGTELYDPNTPYNSIHWDNYPEGFIGQHHMYDLSEMPGQVFLQAQPGCAAVPVTLTVEYWYMEDGQVKSYGSETDDVTFMGVTVSVNVDSSDHHTAKVASTLGANGLDHFVTAKDQGDTVLVATVTPQLIPGHHLTWSTTGGVNLISPAVNNDEKTVKFSTATAGGVKAPIKVLIDGVTCYDNGVAWVVWCSANQPYDENGPHRDFRYTLLGEPRTAIWAAYSFAQVIQPTEIISDQDRPDLGGAWTVPPPMVPDEDNQVYNHGSVALQDGADLRWDTSRQVRISIINPYNLDFGPSPQYQNWPDYPYDETCGNVGNDDTFTTGEDDNPYDPPPNELIGGDQPTLYFPSYVGSNGNTFEVRLYFRAFARLQLGQSWYRISDWGLYLDFRH